MYDADRLESQQGNSSTNISASLFERLISDLRQKPILLGALLVLGILFLYGPVTHHEFLLFDDDVYVTKNTHVTTGLKFDNVVWAFTSFYASNWHPLTWLSHMADCQLFGPNPGLHHLVNVALHAANVLLLFFMLQKATGAVLRSWFVCALFAVHPLNVETVAWVAQRKSLLCTLFSLLTIVAYGWYIRRPHWRRYLFIVAAFAMALMAKPMAVSVPLVLLLLDYWPLDRNADVPFRRRWLRLSLEKLPLLLLSAASCAVTMVAQRFERVDISSLPFSVRVQNAIVSYVAYIGKTVSPARLAVFYPHPWHPLPWSDVIAAAVILVAITTAVLRFHRARYLTMGWFLFVITLIPVIGIIQVGFQAMADRYAYVPCIGLFVISAWGLAAIVEAASLPRLAPAVCGLCLILALAAAARRYVSYWQNGITLFTHARTIVGWPDPILEKAFADALTAAGRYDEAFQHYSEACVLRPNDSVCHYNMGNLLLFHQHRLREALEQYQIAGHLAEKKDIVLSCLINSGRILLELGDYQNAEMKFAAALQMDPNNSTAERLRQQALNPRF